MVAGSELRVHVFAIVLCIGFIQLMTIFYYVKTVPPRLKNLMASYQKLFDSFFSLTVRLLSLCRAYFSLDHNLKKESYTYDLE
jgi:uncharacterized membrane protein YedE/YeeE